MYITIPLSTSQVHYKSISYKGEVTLGHLMWVPYRCSMAHQNALRGDLAKQTFETTK